MFKIGVTERGDGGLDQSWREKLDRVAGAIIITKAPQLLLAEGLPDRVMVHCTITGWGGSIIEPNVAPAEETIKAYWQLVERYGGERVVLRIDPIILIYSGVNGLARAEDVFTDRRGRVRISFMDIYPHVRNRFNAAGLSLNFVQDFHFALGLRKKAAQSFPGAEVCAEPGFACTGCVSERDLKAMGIEGQFDPDTRGWQRKLCQCAAGKTELLTKKEPCPHRCLYCYWKFSEDLGAK